MSDQKLNEYAFDVTIVAAMRVKATSEQAARDQIAKALDCSQANLGTWPDGSPIQAEVSTDARGFDIGGCYEVNGEITEDYKPASQRL